jgi:hypothetical protein
VSGTQGPEASREEQAARARPEVMFLNRLETLERDNRRLQRSANLAFMGIAVLLGLVVALVWVTGRHGMPGSVAQEVAARQFVLRDSKGALRGAWGLGDDGAVRLVLQDPTGRPRVKVSVLQDGTSGLSFSDSSGHPRAVFALLPDQTGSMAFADETGKTRSVLGISADGSSNIVFADQSGSTRAGLGVDARGQSTFTLTDRVNEAAQQPVTESVGGEAVDSPAAPPAPAKGKARHKP